MTSNYDQLQKNSDSKDEGHKFIVPSSGPLWPKGLALQDREDPADSCSCPDAHQCFPCCVPCCGYPVYFAEATLDDTRVSTASKIEYPWCMCLPGCRPSWWIDRADVNGVPLRFEAWDCKGDCCGPAIKVFDISDQSEGAEPKYIGQSEMRCSCCNCCGQQELARVRDANDNIVIRRYGEVCCCATINKVVDRSCCSCYNSYRWNVKAKDEDGYTGAVTERYHCCSLCYPAQLAYTQGDMDQLANKLDREQQKLLPVLLLSMWWRGARVSEQSAEDGVAA